MANRGKRLESDRPGEQTLAVKLQAVQRETIATASLVDHDLSRESTLRDAIRLDKRDRRAAVEMNRDGQQLCDSGIQNEPLLSRETNARA